MDESLESKQAESSRGEGELQTDLLDTDKRRLRGDLRLITTAVRKAWPIPEAKRVEIVDRLLEVVAKREVAVMTKDGVEILDGPADANAIGASRVLVTMDSLNQADFWNQNKNERLDAGQSTENIAYRPAPTYDLPMPPDIAKRLTGDN